MGFFSKIGALIGAAFSAFGKTTVLEAESEEDLIIQEFEEAKLRVVEKFDSIKPFAKMADENYLNLLYYKLQRVPAVALYTGNYEENITSILSKIEALDPALPSSLARLESLSERLTLQATHIQVFLHEETSSLEAAKLYDATFIKGVEMHIPPHLPKGADYYDATMSVVMEAIRNFESYAQSVVDLYGSQRLINATYEAVEDGEDAMDYVKEVMDLYERKISPWKESLHEDVIVPYAGFFDEDFFL